MSSSKLIPLEFSIAINAPIETVWHKMLDQETYKIWTSVIQPGSYYEGSWDLGHEISFKSARSEGMSGTITENEYLKVVKITYKDRLNQNGTLDTKSTELQNSFDVHEKFTFTKSSETDTKLEVFLEAQDSFLEFMKEQWPKALEKLKQISE